jgi:hypothetical protein
MSVSGGVKFFEKNYSLFKDGATASASSNEDAVNYLLDTNVYTRWESVGSNDVTVETITITLNESKTIDRLLLLEMNLKDYDVKYHNGAMFVAFTNVVGVNGLAKSGITETAQALPSYYYEFDSVTTDQIQITMNTTQTANDEKYINGVVVTEEIGTLEGFPRVKPSSSRNETKVKTLSRKYIVQKTYETSEIRITFKTHPFQNDLDIIETLFNREDTFLVYPCGGRTGTDYFKIEQINWRLKDIYNMQIINKLKNEFEKGVYTIGFNKTISMVEHI